MKDSLRKQIAEISQTKSLVLFVVGFVSIGLLLAYFYSPLPGGVSSIVRLQFSFISTSFREVLSLWGQYGTTIFLRYIWLDYLYPLFYSLMLCSLLARHLLSKIPLADLTKNHANIIMLPLMAGFLDCMENNIHVFLLVDLLPIKTFWVALASFMALFKWMVLLICVGFWLKK